MCRVTEIRKANAEGESKKALFLVTDDMVEDLSICGTQKECRDKIKRYAKGEITKEQFEQMMLDIKRSE
jgi:hypothetical protein